MIASLPDCPLSAQSINRPELSWSPDGGVPSIRSSTGFFMAIGLRRTIVTASREGRSSPPSGDVPGVPGGERPLLARDRQHVSVGLLRSAASRGPLKSTTISVSW